jgi:hypothetical protein
MDKNDRTPRVKPKISTKPTRSNIPDHLKPLSASLSEVNGL